MIEPTSIRTFQPRRRWPAVRPVTRNLLTDLGPGPTPVADGTANWERRARLMAALPNRIDAGIGELPGEYPLPKLVTPRQAAPQPMLSPVVLVLLLALVALGLM